jgi:hypothetical protein
LLLFDLLYKNFKTKIKEFDSTQSKIQQENANKEHVLKRRENETKERYTKLKEYETHLKQIKIIFYQCHFFFLLYHIVKYIYIYFNY